MKWRSLRRCRIKAYNALQRTDYRILDRLALGVILLNRAARILYANEAARLLDGEGKPLRLRNSKVAHGSVEHSRRLDDLVQSALRGLPMAAIGVPRPDGGPPLTLIASSVRGQDVGRFSLAHLHDAAVMLFIIDPVSKSGIPPAWLMDAYGLTPAEARVAISAATNGSVPETANRLNLSPNTVKTHLRQIFLKMGISRQSELASLIAALRSVRAE
jgi:DNA-binding CsgD family transcriptional regulator